MEDGNEDGDRNEDQPNAPVMRCSGNDRKTTMRRTAERANGGKTDMRTRRGYEDEAPGTCFLCSFIFFLIKLTSIFIIYGAYLTTTPQSQPTHPHLHPLTEDCPHRCSYGWKVGAY